MKKIIIIILLVLSSILIAGCKNYVWTCQVKHCTDDFADILRTIYNVTGDRCLFSNYEGYEFTPIGEGYIRFCCTLNKGYNETTLEFSRERFCGDFKAKQNCNTIDIELDNWYDTKGYGCTIWQKLEV